MDINGTDVIEERDTTYIPCREYGFIRRDRIVVKAGVYRALVGIIFKKNLYGTAT